MGREGSSSVQSASKDDSAESLFLPVPMPTCLKEKPGPVRRDHQLTRRDDASDEELEAFECLRREERLVFKFKRGVRAWSFTESPRRSAVYGTLGA